MRILPAVMSLLLSAFAPMIVSSAPFQLGFVLTSLQVPSSFPQPLQQKKQWEKVDIEKHAKLMYVFRPYLLSVPIKIHIITDTTHVKWIYSTCRLKISLVASKFPWPFPD